MTFKIMLAVFCTALFFSCNKKEESIPAAPANDTITVSPTDSVAGTNQNPVNETSEETTSTVEKSNPKSALSLQQFLQSVRKTPQVFTINASKESKIAGAEKTTLTFPANAFVSAKTGKPVSGNVTIKLTEYYQLSDMILANLSTTTHGQMLETGGMFYVSATAGNEPLELQKGKSYSIEFPKKSNKPGMEIYNGERDKNGNINWVLDNTSERQEPEQESDYELVTFIDEQAIYPGGNEALYEFVSRNFEVSKDNAGGTLLVSFIVETDGNVSDVKVLRGLTKAFDNEAIRVVKKLKGFTPAKRKGAAIRSLYTLPIRINSEYGSRDGMSSIPITQQQKIVTEATNSFFSTTRLGWINCDRLWKNNNAPKIDLAVQLEETKNSVAYLIFHRYKSILHIPVFDIGAVYKSLPGGEKVTLVVIRSTKDDLQLSLTETVTSGKPITDLKFTTMTKEAFKTEIKKLNQLDKA